MIPPAAQEIVREAYNRYPAALGGESAHALQRAFVQSLTAFTGLRYPDSLDLRPSAQYALVAWLDELFCGIEAFGWRGRPLENHYEGNTRAHHFWEQADAAIPARLLPDNVALILEVFILCVLLGFAGERTDPADRTVWVLRAFECLGRKRPPALTVRTSRSPLPSLLGRGWRWPAFYATLLAAGAAIVASLTTLYRALHS